MSTLVRNNSTDSLDVSPTEIESYPSFDFAQIPQMLRDDPVNLAAWLNDSLRDPEQDGQWVDFDFAVKAIGATKIAPAAGLSQPTVHEVFKPDRQPASVWC